SCNMDFKFLQNLLSLAEVFSEKYPSSSDMNLFAQWLGEQAAQAAPRAMAMPEMSPTESVESVIFKYLIYLNRYARGYLKKALGKTELTSVDEFVFLVNLLNRGSATKMELIERARLDKPMGMEVWRRLYALGFVTQEDHETDKRSKKISLSPAGRAAVFGSLEAMNQVVQLVTGNLNESEKHQLLELLKKLEDFHLPIHQSARSSSWDEILDRSSIN
ncbi:MAG: MarR family winged helix-turn-helix transcriptional regulator, partial [Saprospiraceae bacterium]